MALTVCTFLWRDPSFKWRDNFTYGAEHVDRLARAVRENLSMDYRFVVVTDQPAEAFSEPMEVVPLWADFRDMGRCFTRLKCFDPAISSVLGERFVWVDLDCVVLGDLTPLFTRAEDFIIWGFDGRDPYKRENAYCGSMVMMDAGARSQVWERFDPVASPRLAASKHLVGSDQAWIEYVLGDQEPTWTSRDGVYSLRAHFMSSRLPGRASRAGKFIEPPANARIVFLHGNVDASMVSVRQSHPWINENWSRYAS